MSSKALESIVQKIIRDAEIQAQEIMQKAKETGKLFYEEAEKNIKKKIEESVNQGRKEAESIKERRIAEAKVYAKRRILDFKEKVIEDVFSRVYNELKKLTKTEKYKEILKGLLFKSALELGGGKLNVIITGEVNPITQQELDQIAQKIAEKTGVNTSLEVLTEQVDSIGGVKIRTSDGRIEVDNTFESILDRLREELRTKAAKILFY
ncbi:MAG: V-type ATP synthase subunit E [Candidatus Odinarchaeia archaeon]